MRKIKINLLAAGILTLGLLAGCSSESTTGVESGDTNTENTQANTNAEDESGMNSGSQSGSGNGNTQSANGETYPDTSYKNPPTEEQSGGQQKQ